MKWIDCKIKLPNVNHMVIICTDVASVSIGYVSKKKPEVIWECNDDELIGEKVVFWTNLPESPIKNPLEKLYQTNSTADKDGK